MKRKRRRNKKEELEFRGIERRETEQARWGTRSSITTRRIERRE